MALTDEFTAQLLGGYLDRMKAISQQAFDESKQFADQLHEHVANPLLLKVQQAGEAAKMFAEIVKPANEEK